MLEKINDSLKYMVIMSYIHFQVYLMRRETSKAIRITLGNPCDENVQELMLFRHRLRRIDANMDVRARDARRKWQFARPHLLVRSVARLMLLRVEEALHELKGAERPA